MKMRGKPGEKRENWLLIKGDDEFARPATAPISSRSGPNPSRPAGPLMSSTANRRAGRQRPERSRRPRARRAQGSRAWTARPRSRARLKPPMPGFIEPMLATLAKAPPTGERWLHEIKFDGYRLQAHIEDGKVTLWTRGGLDWTKKFGDGRS